MEREGCTAVLRQLRVGECRAARPVRRSGLGAARRGGIGLARRKGDCPAREGAGLSKAAGCHRPLACQFVRHSTCAVVLSVCTLAVFLRPASAARVRGAVVGAGGRGRGGRAPDSELALRCGAP